MGFGNSKEEQNPAEDFNYLLVASKSIIKIDISNKFYSGFLLKLFKDDQDFFCLVTTKEAITKELIERKEYIKFFYDDESKIKKISLNSEERLIKIFEDQEIDSIVIEILSTDGIEENYFLLPMINYLDELEELKNEEIAMIQKPNGKLTFSTGTIVDINKNEFIHSIKGNIGSLGYPIFLKGIIKVLAIQKEENKANFIAPIFKFFKNSNNSSINNLNLLLNQTENKPSIKKSINYKNLANNKSIKEELNNEIKYENGNYYKGEIKNRKREGKGIEYYKNGGIKYEGNWVDDMPEGNGKFIEEEGNYYIGQFKKGLKHGKGNEYNKEGKIMYEGDFVEGQKEGNGKYIFKSGRYYIGQFKNNKRHGKGIDYYENGTILYEGDFIDDKWEGNGRLNFPGNKFYHIGKFKNGKCHGEGKFCLINDDIILFEGNWVDHYIKGKGIQYDSNGKILYEGNFNKIYDGEGKFYLENGEYFHGNFKQGKIQGKGKLYYKNGNIHYEGDFVDNHFEGKGKLYLENGEYFIGEFKNNFANGKGKIYTKEGELQYEGDVVQGFPDGNGKYFLDDGCYYIGQFKKGNFNGKGIMYRKDQTVLYEGEFVENCFEGKGKYFNEDGSYYIGHWKNDQRHGEGKEYDKNGNFICEKEYNEGLITRESYYN